MEKFVTFRWKDSGILAEYPEHYATHPVFGSALERYEDSDEYEVDKVVVGGHEVPVEQRSVQVATPLDELNVEELKTALRKRDLPVGGTKDELVARIESDNKESD